MTPVELLEGLQCHYAKRHASDAAQVEWAKDMLAIIGRSDPFVLRRTYELIRDEYEERAFPLPATLRKFITRAAEQIYPEKSGNENDKQYPWSNKSLRMKDDPRDVEKWRAANEWQKSVIKKYGDWKNYWNATKHLHDTNAGIRGDYSEPPEPKPLVVANRDHFATRPNWNSGSLSDLTKRQTGEDRDEYLPPADASVDRGQNEDPEHAHGFS